MSLLIYSGLLYLFGITIILTIKPELMFSKDGNWKEFGLGRNKDKYTWLPFWLFAILWAMISYIIILVISSNYSTKNNKNTEIMVSDEIIESENISSKNFLKKKSSITDEMKKGYYILDVNETMKKGIPKYIYLGPDTPNLIYHNITE